MAFALTDSQFEQLSREYGGRELAPDLLHEIDSECERLADGAAAGLLHNLDLPAHSEIARMEVRRRFEEKRATSDAQIRTVNS